MSNIVKTKNGQVCGEFGGTSVDDMFCWRVFLWTKAPKWTTNNKQMAGWESGHHFWRFQINPIHKVKPCKWSDFLHFTGTSIGNKLRVKMAQKLCNVFCRAFCSSWLICMSVNQLWAKAIMMSDVNLSFFGRSPKINQTYIEKQEQPCFSRPSAKNRWHRQSEAATSHVHPTWKASNRRWWSFQSRPKSWEFQGSFYRTITHPPPMRWYTHIKQNMEVRIVRTLDITMGGEKKTKDFSFWQQITWNFMGLRGSQKKVQGTFFQNDSGASHSMLAIGTLHWCPERKGDAAMG